MDTAMNEVMNENLEMRWLPVTDQAGRTHMEAVWVTVSRLAVDAVGAAGQAISSAA